MKYDEKTTEDYITDWAIERMDAWEELSILREKLFYVDDNRINIAKLKRYIAERIAYMEYCDRMIDALSIELRNGDKTDERRRNNGVDSLYY